LRLQFHKSLHHHEVPHTHTCFPRGDLGSDAVSACRHLISVCKFSKYPCSSFISFSRTTYNKGHFILFLNKIMNPSASTSISHIFTEGSLHVLITKAVKQCAINYCVWNKVTPAPNDCIKCEQREHTDQTPCILSIFQCIRSKWTVSCCYCLYSQEMNCQDSLETC